MQGWVRAITSNMQGLWLGASLVRELRGHPSWAVVLTGDHENQNEADNLGWTWFHYPLAGLGSSTHWCL